jgi:hypothetical protein
MREVVDEIGRAIPDDDRVLGLDRVLASVDRSQIIPKETPGVKADPPTIFFSKGPAALVNIDGDPIWSPIKENDLKYAVNTNWDLFLHEPTKTYYLRNEQSWLQARTSRDRGRRPQSCRTASRSSGRRQLEGGQGRAAGKKLPPQGCPGVRQHGAGRDDPDRRRAQVRARAGHVLLWVSNTESDIFRMGQRHRLLPRGGALVLGAGFTRPVDVRHAELRPDFQKISLEHPASRVLASVPGTQQAAEACCSPDPADRAREQEGA